MKLKYVSQLNQSLTQDNNPLVAIPDSEKIAAAQYTCTQLNGGRSIDSLDDEILGASFDIGTVDAREVFTDFLITTQVLAIYEYCPQHMQQLEDDIEANRQNY